MVPEPDIRSLTAAIVDVFPEHAASRFTAFSSGWDSIAIDVDDRLVFKFPRNEEARQRLAVEARLLAVIRPAVSMPVPDLTLHRGSLLFSRHVKLPGEHLVTAQYEALPEESRRHLAADLALFYAELHGLAAGDMAAAGARSIKPWLQPADILRRAWPLLDVGLRRHADRTIAGWQALAPDPYGTTYGFFDGHGWNMAFDHARGRLNGMYDFGDSGFGALHQEFIYSNMIARDLTARIVAAYETLTGRRLDRQRIELLYGVLRLSELAELADDLRHVAAAVRNVADCAAQHPA